jgi:hypothetical protein
MNTERNPGTGRFISTLSDQERFAGRVHKLLSMGYSVDRAERQAADELHLAHMIEMDDSDVEELTCR